MERSLIDTATLPLAGAGAPVSPSRPKGREPRALVGDFIRRPEWLWLTHVAPIALLLAWTAHTFSIIRGDFSADQCEESFALAVGLAAVAAIAGVMALADQRAGRLLSNARCSALLVMSLAVMGAGVLFTLHTIPWTVPEWLANREELLSESFCLGMPGAFYAILVLCSHPLRRHGGVEFGVLVGATTLGAVVFYGLIFGIASLRLPVPDWCGTVLVVLAVFGGGTAVTALITRATLIAYTGLRRTRPVFQRCFMFVAAVIGPIAGLYLNKEIPFPVDFQAPVIYLLALVNGGLLLLPAVRSLFWHRAIWLAQCVLFPFSAYFFIVFLPWLPTSLFAMIAIGAGFLILAPLVLGIFHASRIADGFQEEVRDGKRWPVAVLGLSAILVLPALGLWSAWQDRQSLDQALSYLYSPDYRKDVTFPGSLPRLASSLQHLRDAKQGIFLPFLTPLYNEIVFHGLVLPDAKIADLQAAFFGDTTGQKASALLRSRSDNNWGFADPVAPDHNVALDSVTVTGQRAGATFSAQLLLTMRNVGANQAEFATTVHLPEGVYVTGFALKIGAEFVPARIVEKKTALWVYEKITEVHRDPGILTFNSRTELNLRVAPFSENETRQARLDLVYADGAPVPVTIGDKMVQLGAAAHPSAPLIVTSCATDAGNLAIANVAQPADWQVNRAPYLDILIDCSQGTSYSPASLATAISQARQAFPGAKLARVSAINFEARDLVPNLVALDQINTGNLVRNLLPRRGGLLQDRFLKRGLLQASDFMQTGPDHALLRPQFILISSGGQAGRREDHLDDFLRLAPDSRVIYTENTAGVSVGEDLVSRVAAPIGNASPVILWRWNDHYAVGAAGPRLVLSFPGGLKGSGPEIYDTTRRQFSATPPGPAIAPDSRFADGVRTWAAQDEALFNPALLNDGAAALIGLSKRTGILIPDSSYIAVESMSQWRMMEDKEKQKLQNKQVFEFEEPVATPEPGTWLLLVLGLAALAIARRRQNPRTGKAILFLLVAGTAALRADPPLAMVHFERYQPPYSRRPPMGDLGLPLGTFAVIEGVLDPDNLSLEDDDFNVTAVNGKPTGRPIRISVVWPSQLADYHNEGSDYTLHGFEIGGWHSGIPIGAQLPFSFRRKFAISSIEKQHGKLVSVARPVDPKYPLSKPDFSIKPDDTRPVGGLGLPLGTIATVRVHYASKPLPMGNPFEIEDVNGIPAPPNTLITIRNLKIKQGESVKLRGFETGEWTSQPWAAPRGEFDSTPQCPFQFFGSFVIIEQEK